MIKKQKTFVWRLEGWTSGPPDKCFLLKDKNDKNDKSYVFFRSKCDFFRFK